MPIPLNSTTGEQLWFTGDSEPVKANIVNVSSVPQRSPFRYPGGKTWLVPRLREWLASQPAPPTVFVEPFAGGGIASLTVAFEQLAERVVMVELDEAVAAVWETILSPKAAGWLANKIVSYELTREACKKDLAEKPKSKRERAFQTILRNRTCRGGIMAPGAGLIGYGENGKGVHSRWYPQTLKRRIRDIGLVRHRIKFVRGDAFAVMEEFAENESAVFFIDPPYTASKKKAGSRLYTHSELDHRQLFETAAAVKGDVLLTYDNADEMLCQRSVKTSQ